MSETRATSSTTARANVARAANFESACRQARKAYPVQNGGLKNRMLGPSSESGCPQQNEIPSPTPSGGSAAAKSSAAQPEPGPHRANSPATAPHANNPNRKISCGSIMPSAKIVSHFVPVAQMRPTRFPHLHKGGQGGQRRH